MKIKSVFIKGNGSERTYTYLGETYNKSEFVEYLTKIHSMKNRTYSIQGDLVTSGCYVDIEFQT